MPDVSGSAMARSILCGLIGAGIQRSLSPALQEEEARHHGIRMHYQLIDLDSSNGGVEALPGLIEAARIMGYAGLNITYPCKQAVISHFGLAVDLLAFHDADQARPHGASRVGWFVHQQQDIDGVSVGGLGAG